MPRPFWILLGLLATSLGVAGIFLPLLPTTPFLLVASFAFARSSPRLHAWLLAHPRMGPMIEQWHRYGAISRRVKLIAVATMLLSLTITALMGFAGWILAAQALVLAGAAAFVLSRPEPPR